MDSLQRFRRKCHATGRDLIPGDRYISVLSDTLKGIQRHDYALENWPGEPEDAICWWSAQIPLPSQVKLRWAPDRVLLAYFRTLFEKQDWNTLNVLAMAMVRRRLMQLKYESREGVESSGPEGLRQMTLTEKDSPDSYTLPEVDLSQVDLSAIESELQEHLFTDEVDWEEESSQATPEA